MKTIRAVAIIAFALLGATVALCQTPPDWSKRTFAAPPDQVYAAALDSISAQHHEIKTKDPATHEVTFHVGMTAWSWGYDMILKVSATETGSEVTVG